MAEATISAAGPVIAAAHAAAWDGARGGQHGENRRPRRKRANRLLEAIVPGKEPDLYDVHFEYDEGGRFTGVSIVERSSGKEVTYLDTDALAAYEESPGLLLERQG